MSSVRGAVSHGSCLLLSAAMLVAGCSDFTGLDAANRVPGVLAYYEDPTVIQVPEVVSRGEEFHVRVRTYGAGCSQQGFLRTRIRRGVVEVRPFDLAFDAQHCPDHLGLFDHSATVVLENPGIVRVAVYGRSLPSGVTLVVERTLEVR